MRLRIGHHLISTDAIAFTSLDTDTDAMTGEPVMVLTIAFTSDTKLYLRGEQALAVQAWLEAGAVEVASPERTI